MVFTFAFLVNLSRLLLDGAPLFLGLGVIIAALAIAVGRKEGWSTGDSLYYGFITATTVGYGDMTPTTGCSKIYAIIPADRPVAAPLLAPGMDFGMPEAGCDDVGGFDFCGGIRRRAS